MSQSYEIEHFVALERAVWQALKDGDASADARFLSDDFVGVYASGIAGKSDHVGQLKNGPTLSWYELSKPQLLVLAEGVVALSYFASYKRVRSPTAAAPESMFITSIWRREHGTWMNVFSQDTHSESDAG